MAASLPPLPAIQGDFEIMLEIYTHESARNPADPHSPEYGSIDRLTALGRKATEMAVYYHYYAAGTLASGTSGEPMLTIREVANRSESALHQTIVAGWMDHYGLRGKIRCYPHTQREDNEIVCNVFYTYVGALYIRNGPASVQAWISALVDPDHPPPAIAESQLPPHSPPQPNGPPPPMIHPQPPPPMPMGQMQSQPTGNLDHLITLQVVNQTAQQRGYNVTYTAQSEGPPHSPLWTVHCCMNGSQVGFAQARSQKMAKEEAAKIAYKSMGWG